MKRMFLFLSLLAACLAFPAFSAEEPSPEEAARQFNQALKARNFERVKTLVTSDSLPIVEAWKAIAGENQDTVQVRQNDNLAVVKIVPPSVPDSFQHLFMRKVDGVWKVDLRGWHKRAEYFQVDPLYSCSSNLKQIGLGLLMYANDKDEMFPAEDGAAGLEALRSNNYLIEPDVFVCPVDKERKTAEKKAALTEKNCSYVYFGELAHSNIPTPGRIPLAFEKPGISHDGVTHVLFVDGHVAQLKGDFKTVSELVEALIAKGGLDRQADFLRKKAAAADLRLKDEKK
ncbi:hypothetical protein SDC9_115511 [bioreactor metagenome]|uniref:Uncharacterized protein n=1 Tax=bioreactor metagenome TaxID=1076179 RepID=A0A645BTN3_9ZZZZ